MDCSIKDFVSQLRIINSTYRYAERVSIRSLNEEETFFFIWEQSTAHDPYSWTEEYYRLGIPAEGILPSLEEAMQKRSSETTVPATFWSLVVNVNTYTGDGGELKQEPTFNPDDWDHERVMAHLRFTSESVEIGFESTRATCL